MDKEKYKQLHNDPRRCLKALRLGNGINTFCDHCNQTVQADAATTELAKRIDSNTLLFFQKCPKCGHKLYWQEWNC